MAVYVMAYRFSKDLLKLSPLAPLSWLGDLFGFNAGSQVVSGVNNFLNKVTGSGLPSADIQSAEVQKQNERELRQTYFQDATKSMQDAGLNTALMYGSGAGSASGGAQSVSPSSAALSDIAQLLTLPAQIKLLNKQADKTDAERGNIEQKTRTEEQETRIKEIAANFGTELTRAQIDNLLKDIEAKDADIELKRNQSDLISSQRDAQDITNEYLPDKYFAEIDKLSADAALARAQEAMQRIQYEYARENGALMSSNDYITLATYLLDIFGVSKGDAKGAASKVVEIVNGANSWIDNKIQSASDWLDDKVVNRIKRKFKR